MLNRRKIRCLAMLILYQIDLRGETDAPLVRESLADYATWTDHDAPSSASVTSDAVAADLTIPADLPAEQIRAITDEAYDLAWNAWKAHAGIDEILCELAPDWPTYRQPPVDRAILRLAAFEMMTNRVPVPVAITEAVQLAKQFCAVQSPSFINAVLDRASHRLKASAAPPTPIPPSPPATSTDPWLDDAIADEADRPDTPRS